MKINNSFKVFQLSSQMDSGAFESRNSEMLFSMMSQFDLTRFYDALIRNSVF